MEVMKIKKGTCLQRSGVYNTCVYEVVSGLLRCYTIDKKGREYTFMFAPEGWIVADATPSTLPAELYIEALEDTEVRIRKKELIGTESQLQAISKRMWVLQQRVIMLMSYTGLERYEHFLQTYPSLVQRVSQKMIASYLGMTPEALSKAKHDALRSNS
ncbi:Crp/Fnr family transcriptional regulator [Tenacibaculum litopenaei]|uniref:Crp/Fnr family transcriptional regulator n=1 Tax=Tenacibaculum litopenaei TaxID=396016 RepID=UPI003895756D